jgi:hypothetical protein
MKDFSWFDFIFELVVLYALFWIALFIVPILSFKMLKGIENDMVKWWFHFQDNTETYYLTVSSVSLIFIVFYLLMQLRYNRVVGITVTNDTVKLECVNRFNRTKTVEIKNRDFSVQIVQNDKKDCYDVIKFWDGKRLMALLNLKSKPWNYHLDENSINVFIELMRTKSVEIKSK